MGNDGGSIPDRRDLVRNKPKAEQADKANQTRARWLFCALSKLKLEEPVVSCALGKLYNKDSIIEFLLDRAAFGDGETICGHIRSLKDVKTLKLTPNHTARPSEDNDVPQFICPLTLKEMNGVQPFVYLSTCGCTFSQAGLKTVAKATVNGHEQLELCPQCGKKYSGANDVVLINPSQDEEDSMRLEMERRRLLEPTKKGKKRKHSPTEDHEPAAKKHECGREEEERDVHDHEHLHKVRVKAVPVVFLVYYLISVPTPITLSSHNPTSSQTTIFMMFLHVAAFALRFFTVAASVQQYLGSNARFFTPFGSLDLVSESTFSTLTHPLFPHHSVRIKRSRFCDETVRAYTGYIDIEARHLFFYFFESRNDPDTDDVIFWTNGGPGCSSSLGLFMELGPCRIPNSNGTVYHPESWNTNANVFFIDQPIGVGFSYADYGETVSTSEEAAQDVAAFVAIFFQNFSQFKGRGFHMSGESYGGRYLPLFASAVYDQNTKLVEQGLTPINLTSVMIGNGMTDNFKMILSYFDMQCSPASVAPFLDIASCVTMKTTLGRCEKWMQKACVDQYDAINCGAATAFCNSVYDAPYRATGKNPYDISRQCDGELKETLCYPATKYIREYLDTPSVRTNLGVDPGLRSNFSHCTQSVGESFRRTQDMLHPTSAYVGALLERGVRVLIYVGAYDFVCNWVGNERWTLALEWSGQEEFVGMPLREWVVDGKRAGRTRSAKGFTFATIDGAGHMVPYDKPKESLEMVQRWLAGEEL
ncbi:Carboxypeptidase Y [Hypsizygus marmoreus]|uniref:Carboxypeptidase Y n=1 Tax=Hypsizygus marmoreus TaxID=39966 RepID=A0A369K1C4_HYPMA|nr:Carboxypeptidase Y [Hypsizygus marmoreus]